MIYLTQPILMSLFNPLGAMRHSSGFRGCHLILQRATIVAHSTDSFVHRLN